MIKQRKTKNLGLNRSKDKERIYKYLEETLGLKEKYCARGTSKKKSKYNFIHEGKNPLPIRNFNLEGIYINKKGKIVIRKKPGLQPYCISCERKYRRGRLDQWRNKYLKLSTKEIYQEYKKNYGEFCHCSMCGKDKVPEDFDISIGMDKGLHNHCKECSKAYTESVGNRWAIYSPDGHQVIYLTPQDKCLKCGSKENLHKDHIWPISKGGTDNKENIQILCKSHNLSKSASIVGLNFVHEIDDSMICIRYRNLLNKAKSENWNLNKFELEISKRVREFIIWKKSLTDEQLKEFFAKEKAKNNRKHSIERAARKFREFCDTAILDINKYISKNLNKKRFFLLTIYLIYFLLSFLYLGLYL